MLLLDDVCARKNLFLVMEYLPGGDLMSLLECVVQLEEDVSKKIRKLTRYYLLFCRLLEFI